METATIIAIIDLAATYGIPIVREAIEALNKDKITSADFAALRAHIKKPEDYFNEPA